MANYLTIDIGNSSAKAIAWVDNQPIGVPLWGNLSPADIEHLCASINGRFDCAAVCSVSDDSRGLAEAAFRESDKHIYLSPKTPMPLDLSHYTSPETLGADRMAAMMGAIGLHPNKNILVVDCGTAVTYDFVNEKGEFMGGNIAPGLGMRLRALHSFTSRLPLVDTNPHAKLWGDNTMHAMQSGALYGVVAETNYYYSRCPEGTELVITGGRAPDISQLLNSTPHTCDTMLVLKGLKNIIDYNENK